jgi:hypothetical protein
MRKVKLMLPVLLATVAQQLAGGEAPESPSQHPAS